MNKKNSLSGTKEEVFGLMTYKLSSSKKIEDIIKNVEKACDSNKFALLHSYAYHEVVKSKGFPIDTKAYVYEICQAKVASMVLTEEPTFTPFMPCRIAVYEENKNVVISTQNMEIMINSLKEDSELYQSTSAMFLKLKLLMSEIIE